MFSQVLFATAIAAAPAGAVPKFECPDAAINRTYAYRWQAFGRHCDKTPDGWVITEFLPKVSWSGPHNTIVCPAGHHLREARWMHDASVAADCARFWFSTNGWHRRQYSSWLGSAVLDVVRVTGDKKLALDLLEPIAANYTAWEKEPKTYRTCPKNEPFPMGGDGKGMFTSIDDREGSEYSLGGNGYRPLFNSAMCAEAKAVVEIARMAKRPDLVAQFSRKAEVLEKGIREKLWNPDVGFFTTVATNGLRNNVRELHGYAPWYFGMSLPEKASAWNQLLDEKGFAAPFGLCFAERRAPGFKISYEGHPCQWNGPSWPFATSIALTGLAHALADNTAGSLGRDAFAKLLGQYAAQQVLKTKDGRSVPWVDENLDPFTGEWIARKILKMGGAKGERGEDYNHSTFADIVIAGLCGVHPHLDGTLELRPLVPASWDYLKLEDVKVHGRMISVYWDRTGTRYGKGAGFSVYANGKEVYRAGSPQRCRMFSPHPLTAGWQDENPMRKIFEEPKVLWKAANYKKSTFVLKKVAGAEGEMLVMDGAIRIVKTNDKGFLIVEGPAFDIEKGREVRLSADVEVSGSNGETAHGFLRAYGKAPNYGVSPLFESDFAAAGIPRMLGLPNSPKGQTYRKYGNQVAKDEVMTPVIVVDGSPSVSTWKGWKVSDLKAEREEWHKATRVRWPKVKDKDREDEAKFAAGLAADTQHTAEVVRMNGISQLLVDGRKVLPIAYKGPHAGGDAIPPPERFSGRPFDGSAVPLMVKDIRLGKVPGSRGYWTKDGFDAKGAVSEIRNSMRLAPKTPFVIAIGCNAYPEFAREEHPEEAMKHEDGSVVMGNAGSCLPTYCMPDPTKVWPWPSYSSRIWRDGVKKCLRELVAELKHQSLDKRIVGIHTFGYQDGQFTATCIDQSPAAKAEYAEFLKEGGHAATNYSFFAMQTGFRAQEEFAREFKRLMGKKCVAIMWCESPFRGRRASSWDVGEFLKSDTMDILVAQPCYVHRLPGLPGGNHLPTASFSLHGKLFFEELDFRTYAALEPGWHSPASLCGVGESHDFEMWQTVFRKHAGTMVAQRMGWWFYDMIGGWFGAPEIVADIDAALKVYNAAGWGQTAPQGTNRRPSPWKPGVAVVVDEAGAFGWEGGEKFLQRPLDFSYGEQLFLLARSGVPFDVYLYADVAANPGLMKSYSLVALGLMRRYDAERQRIVKSWTAAGKTVVHMPRCGELGGLREATGIDLNVNERADHHVTAEPNFDCEVNGLQCHDMLRNCGIVAFPPPQLADWPRNSVVESPGVQVLARYTKDRRPAIAERGTGNGERGTGKNVVFAEAGGISAGAFNKLAREAGAYVALPPDIAQVDMNGDFISVHALTDFDAEFRLPYPCKVANLKSRKREPVRDGTMRLRMSTGETCQFAIAPNYAGEALQKCVDAGEIPGCIVVYEQDGVKEVSCLGYADADTKRPITLDSPFQQCSQTKSFCGATIAMLIDEGKVSIDDPVAKYLPEFSELWVRGKESGNGGGYVLRKAKTPLTIRHCMCHMGGFPFELPNALQMGGWNHRMPLRSVAATAASQPLKFEPGSEIGYSNVGIDICAAVVEVVSGMRWETFLKERLFKPLGMTSTTFWPTGEQVANRIELATVKRGEKAVMRKEITPRDWMQAPFGGDRVFPSAGAGLWTTARDQLKFVRMLMNLGVAENGTRVIKSETVKAYFAKTIRPEGKGCYGLGVAAPLQDDENAWFGMGGAWGTDFAVNYHRKALKLWVVQFLGDRDAWDSVRRDAEAKFFAQAIDDSSVKAYTGRLSE